MPAAFVAAAVLLFTACASLPSVCAKGMRLFDPDRRGCTCAIATFLSPLVRSAARMSGGGKGWRRWGSRSLLHPVLYDVACQKHKTLINSHRGGLLPGHCAHRGELSDVHGPEIAGVGGWAHPIQH